MIIVTKNKHHIVTHVYYERLKIMKKTGLFLAIVLFLSVSPFCHQQPGYANNYFEEISTDEIVFIKGIIGKVSMNTMQFTVRPLNGKRVLITIGSQTLLEGLYTIEELDRGQQAKIWYSIKKDGNKALKIKKMMDLGC